MSSKYTKMRTMWLLLRIAPASWEAELGSVDGRLCAVLWEERRENWLHLRGQGNLVREAGVRAGVWGAMKTGRKSGMASPSSRDT